MTEEELSEAITHLALYPGMPTGATAVAVAGEALATDSSSGGPGSDPREEE